MPLIRFIIVLFDRIFLIVGVLLGAQIPLFIQQYSQRLSGHVAELDLFVSNLRYLASQTHKTLAEYILKFQNSVDPDFAKHGDFMNSMVQRQEKMHQALQYLINSPKWQKLFYFFKDLQTEVAEKTLSDFQPGISLNTESLIYMAIGGVIFFVIYQFILQLGLLVSRLIKNLFKKFGLCKIKSANDFMPNKLR